MAHPNVRRVLKKQTVAPVNLETLVKGGGRDNQGKTMMYRLVKAAVRDKRPRGAKSRNPFPGIVVVIKPNSICVLRTVTTKRPTLG